MKKRILAIFEEPHLRELFATVFRLKGGYDVEEAENGAMGLEMVHDFKPDLVFCQDNMSEINGFGVVDALKGNPETSNIIVIPYIIFRERYRDRLDELDGYLTMPIKPTDVLEMTAKFPKIAERI